MTEILINLPDLQEGSFQSIAPTIYYNTQTSTFYRLAFLPHTTIFHNDQVSQPRFAALTQYNPCFYIINQLLKKSIPIGQISAKLKHIKMELFADRKVEGIQEIYVANKAKIYDYLETRVQRLEECLSKRLAQKTLEVDKGITEEKTIREEIVLILKSEINDKQFIDAFAKERYNYQNVRKLIPYMEEHQETLAKKKVTPKKQPKKEEKRLEHGQKTLFGFMKTTK